MMTQLLQLVNVSRVFGKRKPIIAVDNVSLDIRDGEFLAIIGPSGAGKSTMLAQLGLLDRPSSGRVLYDGRSVGDLPDRERSRLRGDDFSFVFQSFHLVGWLTAVENVATGLSFRSSIDRWEARLSVAHEVLTVVGLQHRASHLASELSGGEQQRVVLARAMARSPRVLLCDEPTGNLDESSSRMIFDHLRRASEAGVTVVVVTHDTTLSSRADRQVEVEQGQIVA